MDILCVILYHLQALDKFELHGRVLGKEKIKQHTA